MTAFDSVVKESLNVKNIATDLKMQSQTIRDYIQDLYNISSQIDYATKEQDLGNKEVLSLIASAKQISSRNIDVVNKLKVIVGNFNVESSDS